MAGWLIESWIARNNKQESKLDIRETLDRENQEIDQIISDGIENLDNEEKERLCNKILINNYRQTLVIE